MLLSKFFETNYICNSVPLLLFKAAGLTTYIPRENGMELIDPARD